MGLGRGQGGAVSDATKTVKQGQPDVSSNADHSMWYFETRLGAFTAAELLPVTWWCSSTSMSLWFSFFRTMRMVHWMLSPGMQSMAGCTVKLCWPQCVAPVGSGAVLSSVGYDAGCWGDPCTGRAVG